MTDPEHGKAEEFTAEAVRYLSQGDGRETAAVWAAVARVYATLAIAAAIEAASVSRGRPGILAPGIAPPVCLSPGFLAQARCPGSSPGVWEVPGP